MPEPKNDRFRAQLVELMTCQEKISTPPHRETIVSSTRSEFKDRARERQKKIDKQQQLSRQLEVEHAELVDTLARMLRVLDSARPRDYVQDISAAWWSATPLREQVLAVLDREQATTLDNPAGLGYSCCIGTNK